MQFEKLPLLVTREVVLFPEQELILEVGRKNSLQNINVAKEKFDNYIIIVSQKDHLNEDPKSEDIFRFATMAKIENIVDGEAGTVKINIKGIDRVKISIKKDTPLTELVSFEIIKSISTNQEEEQAYINQINSFMEKNWKIKNPSSSFDSVLRTLEENMKAGQIADAVASFMHVSQIKKQAVLEEIDVLKRLQLVFEYLNSEKRSSELEEEISKKVKTKLNDQQKDFFLRERLKAIKEELGEGHSKDSEADKFREMLKNHPYPDYIKEKLESEIKKFEMIPAISGESSVVRVYIEWLLNLPWWQESKDNDSLKKR